MRTTTLHDRVTIHDLSKAAASDVSIAQHVGWSVGTVRKWRKRWSHASAPLCPTMGRPVRGPLSTFAPPVHAALDQWRQSFPGWGPMTLLTQAQHEPALADQRLPSRPTIARWLKEAGGTRPYERHGDLLEPKESSATAPHEQWEMDGRGYEFIPGVGVVALINLTDRFSRVKLLSYPCYLGETRASRHATTADYQLILRLTFAEWGLPDRLCIDRESVFYDNRSKSPFPMRSHLWLVALGVACEFGRPGQPTERAIIERSHQTWAHQVLDGQSFASWDALYWALRQRRDFLNQYMPCTSCQDQAPLICHPDAVRPRRLYRPEVEQEMLDLSRVWTYLSQGRWFRKASNIGSVSLGEQVYCLGQAWRRQDVEITFAAPDQMLTFATADHKLTKSFTIKGITAESLMGELGPLLQVPGFQIHLPFSWDEMRVIRLCETLCDTT